ncbi:hypothetical protein VCHA56P521_90006 [Vibrio chagasii]|nr:hypothetical protein VCHA50O404_120007 [Vibrio chagasii]CAH6979460.1 hypothetical protein VCHA50O387_120007 [Vibrio chagasii]CAH7001294.1 hypothetical protein VCHA28FP16_50006 [Vibrio chagasii]CAH7012336.1 hypothetical protein VCHA34O109_50006 [Vibrio chagasii]CAH7060374.1 hypothetical protein VCHA37O173_70218 [Vibrio chagasii]
MARFSVMITKHIIEYSCSDIFLAILYSYFSHCLLNENLSSNGIERPILSSVPQ